MESLYWCQDTAARWKSSRWVAPQQTELLGKILRGRSTRTSHGCSLTSPTASSWATLSMQFTRFFQFVGRDYNFPLKRFPGLSLAYTLGNTEGRSVVGREIIVGFLGKTVVQSFSGQQLLLLNRLIILWLYQRETMLTPVLF